MESLRSCLCILFLCFKLRHHGCVTTVANEFLGSDHSIVLTAVKATTTPQQNDIPKWNFSKADWRKFCAYCDQTLNSFSISLDYFYCLFETSVREAALDAIPHSKKSHKIPVRWWNKQCDIAVNHKKHAFNRMKRTRLQCDIIIFKRCRAKARSFILEAKTSSWQQYCTSLSSNSNRSRLASNQKLFRTTFLSSHSYVSCEWYLGQK